MPILHWNGSSYSLVIRNWTKISNWSWSKFILRNNRRLPFGFCYWNTCGVSMYWYFTDFYSSLYLLGFYISTIVLYPPKTSLLRKTSKWYILKDSHLFHSTIWVNDFSGGPCKNLFKGALCVKKFNSLITKMLIKTSKGDLKAIRQVD